MRPLRVGIIGANARGGWAGESHVPAVRGLEGLTLDAIATTSRESAEEAAHAFGVARAFASGAALIADPAIDVVTIATRVPDHRALVLAATAAGKHVYCEWPLGSGGVQAEELADAASGSAAHNVVGLQLRGSPTLRHARECLSSGAVGRVLSIRAYSSTLGFGPAVAAPFAYLEDPSAFANLVTIQAAHTLDLLFALGGAPAELAGLTSRQFPEITVGDGSGSRRRETFDHVLVHGRLEGGVPFTVEVAGGSTGEAPFSLDIVGELGSLRFEGGAPRGLQSGRIALVHDGKPVPVDEGELANMPDAAVNVAGLYAVLRDDVASATVTAPGFDHAVVLTRLVEAVLRSSSERRFVAAEEWSA